MEFFGRVFSLIKKFLKIIKLFHKVLTIVVLLMVYHKSNYITILWFRWLDSNQHDNLQRVAAYR